MLKWLAAPWRTARIAPPALITRMMPAFTSALAPVTDLPTSKVWIPTSTVIQDSPIATSDCSNTDACPQTRPVSTPVNSRYTDGIHKATLTQYQ